MAKISLTAGRVSDFICPPDKAQAFLWDADAPGLGLRATANGAKAYIFQAKLNEKTIRQTIGDPRTHSIPDARKQARALQALVDRGIDPRQEQEAQREKTKAVHVEAKRQVLTLGDVWPLYLEARRNKWGERHYRDHVNLASAGGATRKRGEGQTVAAPLAVLMPLTLSELTSARLAGWLETESAHRPTNAALSYRLLRALIRWAAEMPEYQGLIPETAYSAHAVRDALQTSAAKEGDCLQREQLPFWFEAVRKIRNPVTSAYLQGLLLTGARREELASLQWADVDFQWRSMTIRDKVEGTRTIPLTPYFASLIAVLPRRNEWVFSSTSAADGHITEPRIAHVQALQAAGLPHVTLHGLRRSFGTLCEWVEMPAGISAQIMGHKPSALAEKHYRRRPLDLLRMWHDKIESWILEQAGIRFEAADPGRAPSLRAVK